MELKVLFFRKLYPLRMKGKYNPLFSRIITINERKVYYLSQTIANSEGGKFTSKRKAAF